METLTFEEIREKYFAVVEAFCFNVLKNRVEAVVNAANVFTTLQTMIAKQGVDKWQDENKVVMSLYYIARQRCIERLQWLRRCEEDRRRNNIFNRFIKKVVVCLKTLINPSLK
jgi:hypothetical protein